MPSSKGPEGTVQAAIVAALTARGFRCVRQNSGRARGYRMKIGETGMADLLVLRDGRCLWLETKRLDASGPKPHQAEWGRDMEPFAPYRWADSVEKALAAVDEVFKPAPCRRCK
jgi:hypothetical protein